MKKKILLALALPLILGVSACSSTPAEDSKDDDTPVIPIVTRFTVAFNVDGARFRTESIKEGEKIPSNIVGPAKEGYDFKGWALNGELIDLETYVVTGNITLEAVYEEIQDQDVLSVDDVKEEGVEYALTMAWWEVPYDPESPKVTSGLTKDHVRKFYKNILKYLTAIETPEADMAKIQFRNYTAATIAEVQDKMTADGDMGLVFGCGNKLSKEVLATEEDGTAMKFEADFGTVDLDGKPITGRMVAAGKDANELAKRIYHWIQDNPTVGILKKELTDDEIAATLAKTYDLTVNIIVDEEHMASTHLEDTTTAVTWPEFEAPEGKRYAGLALEEDGEVVITDVPGTALKYNDLIELAGDSNTLNLYVVFEDIPVVKDDLNVMIQVNGNNLTLPEAELMKARFTKVLEAEAKANETSVPKVNFDIVDAAATEFTEAVEKAENVDVIVGGNKPVNNFPQHTEGTTANAGLYHFRNTSRKVIIYNGVNHSDEHFDLAKKFYTFVTDEAPVYNLSTAYWMNWITGEEASAIQQGIQARVATYLGIGDEESVYDVYKVGFADSEYEETKVDPLVARTNEDNVDLCVGPGGNAVEKGLVVVGIKDLPAGFLAASRKVAYMKDNGLVKDIYDNYFVAQPAEEGGNVE